MAPIHYDIQVNSRIEYLFTINLLNNHFNTFQAADDKLKMSQKFHLF